MRDGPLDRLDPLLALGLELGHACGQLVLGLANCLELGPLLAEEPHPEIQPGGELGEVVHPDENVHEGHVPAPVNLRSALLQVLLGLGEPLLGGVEILLRPRYLPV